MADYHRFLSDRRWYRDSPQPTTRSPSSSPDITSTADWSYWYDLLAIAEPKMDTRITLPSHGRCCPSRRHALRELSQHAQQSEALEPSDINDNLKDLIVAGMGRMQITSSLASLDGYVYIHDPQLSAKLKQTEWKLRHLLNSEDG